MKKTILVLCTVIGSLTSYSQTAVDCSPVDCDGTTHNLFTELDAGKIIVIGWTMPCATCAAPLLDVHNAVLNFAVSNPGIVEYWLADDFANTDCTTIEGWCSSNGITNATYFRTSELDMFDYGSAGMPKVVVVGCTDHKVYYNTNNTPTGSGVTNAINTALNDLANSCLLGVEENTTSNLQCFPNPASKELKVTFNNDGFAVKSIELYSLNGELIETQEIHDEVEALINTSNVADGFYILKLNFESKSEQIKIQVIH